MAAAIDFVSRILDELGSTPTPDMLVAALIPQAADSCLVFQRQNDRYHARAWGHIDPGKSAMLDHLASIYHPSTDDPRDPVALVGRTGKGVLVSHITRENIERATDDPRVHAIFEAFGPRNVVVVPIRNGDYVLITAISDTPRSLYEDDLEFLTQLAARLATLLP